MLVEPLETETRVKITFPVYYRLDPTPNRPYL